MDAHIGLFSWQPEGNRLRPMTRYGFAPAPPLAPPYPHS